MVGPNPMTGVFIISQKFVLRHSVCDTLLRSPRKQKDTFSDKPTEGVQMES